MPYVICEMAVRRRVLASSHHTTHRRVECVQDRCVQTWDLSSKTLRADECRADECTLSKPFLRSVRLVANSMGWLHCIFFLRPWSLFVIIYDHPWFSTSEFARQSWCLAGETTASDAAETRRPNRSPWCGGQLGGRLSRPWEGGEA